jgi:hypothetical protein
MPTCHHPGFEALFENTKHGSSLENLVIYSFGDFVIATRLNDLLIQSPNR